MRPPFLVTSFEASASFRGSFARNMATGSVKFLGTSDGLPSAERNHASLLVDLGERVYLFDCGEPVSHTLKRAKVSFDSIDRVFLSHLHADHCGGFLMLMQSCWLESRQKRLPVHMPAEGIQPFRNLMQACYLFDGLLPFSLNMQPLRAREAVVDGGIRITPHPTQHLQLLRQNFGKNRKQKFEAFAFEVAIGKSARIAYSGDIGTPCDLEPLVAKPLDVLIVELSHFTTAELFEYLRPRPIKKIVLTHLNRKYWKNPSVDRLARRYFRRNQLVIAKDGLEIKF